MFLLDSVIMIDHLNNIKQATDFIIANQSDILISVVTRAEVLVGYDDAMRPIIAKFLDDFPTLIIDKDTADLASNYRRNKRIKLPDAFQIALAYQHHCTLITRNTKDFKQNDTYFNREDLVFIPYQLTP